MRKKANWKWTTSVLVTAVMAVAQLDRAALAGPLAGELKIVFVPHSEQTTHQVVVDILDGDSPAAGASVEFRLPDTGPGGKFLGGERSSFVVADDQGRARSGVIYSNSVSGPFTVAVLASQGNATGGAAVAQNNPPPTAPTPAKKSLGQRLKNWKVITGIAAVGIVVATVLLSRDEKPAEVTIGVPTVGGPQ